MISVLGRQLASSDGEIHDPDPRAKGWCQWLARSISATEADTSPVGSTREFQELAFQHWLAEDPEEASRWLADQPPSQVRDSFVTALFLGITREDPEAAHQWLLSLSPESRKAFYTELSEYHGALVNSATQELMIREGFDPQAGQRRFLEEHGIR